MFNNFDIIDIIVIEIIKLNNRYEQIHDGIAAYSSVIRFIEPIKNKEQFENHLARE